GAAQRRDSSKRGSALLRPRTVRAAAIRSCRQEGILRPVSHADPAQRGAAACVLAQRLFPSARGRGALLRRAGYATAEMVPAGCGWQYFEIRRSAHTVSGQYRYTGAVRSASGGRASIERCGHPRHRCIPEYADRRLHAAKTLAGNPAGGSHTMQTAIVTTTARLDDEAQMTEFLSP